MPVPLAIWNSFPQGEVTEGLRYWGDEWLSAVENLAGLSAFTIPPTSLHEVVLEAREDVVAGRLKIQPARALLCEKLDYELAHDPAVAGRPTSMRASVEALRRC